MVDEERVTRLLERIQADLDDLRDAAALPAAQLGEDRVALAAVKYRFVTAIEGCARVGHHLAVSEGWSAPETNGDAIEELGRRGVLAQDLATRLRSATGFRNLLVHQYGDVDDHRVVEHLAHIGDFAAFVQQTATWLRSQA